MDTYICKPMYSNYRLTVLDHIV